MAGRHARPGRASVTAPVKGRSAAARHVQGARTFGGTPLTVQGVTRDAMGSASLLGSSIPKGLFSSAISSAHASGAYNLTTSESAAQLDISSVLASIEAISTSRQLRAISRNAEGVAPTSTPLSVEAARLLANGRGPRVTVMGMVAGDVARAIAEFDRYGYTVNRAMVPPRLDPMTSRSYWQLEDPTIVGSMPQAHRETIAAAFEQGVTVWTNVAEIGTQSANSPRAGVSY